MANRAPVLLVDVGNTLLTRTAPGPFERAQTVLAGLGYDTGDLARQRALARGLLTSCSRDQAVRDVTCAFRLAPGDSAALRETLECPEGDPVLLPGGETLVRTAAQAGWHVVVATNAAAWSEPLPPQLQRHVSGILSSSNIGFLKQERGFWTRARTTYGVDYGRSLVLGDNPVADGQAPAGVGLCAVLVGGGGPTLTEVAGWLAGASSPSARVTALAAGRPTIWAGTRILEVPHLSPLVSSVTRRRVWIDWADGRPLTGTIVRRRNLPPALVVPGDVGPGGVLWLSLTEDRRQTTAPQDLVEALARGQASMDGLPERERRHLVSLVREAREPAVRQARIGDIVAFLGATRNARG